MSKASRLTKTSSPVPSKVLLSRSSSNLLVKYVFSNYGYYFEHHTIFYVAYQNVKIVTKQNVLETLYGTYTIV